MKSEEQKESGKHRPRWTPVTKLKDVNLDCRSEAMEEDTLNMRPKSSHIPENSYRSRNGPKEGRRLEGHIDKRGSKSKIWSVGKPQKSWKDRKHYLRKKSKVDLVERESGTRNEGIQG